MVNHDRLRWLGFAALSLIALFWVPYHVAMKPSVSESYLFGYNNRVGQIVLAAALLVYGMFYRASFPAEAALSPDSPPIGRSTLLKVLAATVLICGAMFYATHNFGGYEESIYLIDRLRLAAEGRIPYLQIEYPYGPFLLYGPLGLASALHLGLTNAYYVFWTINALCGYLLLYKVINWVDFPCAHKRSIFLIFVLATLPFLRSTGINYTMFRFILPSFFGLLAFRMNAHYDGWRQRIQAALLTWLFSGCVMVVSPELGLSYGFGSLLLFAVYWKFSEVRSWAGLAMAAALLGLNVWIADRFGLLETIRSFAQGGLNFPIQPAPHILVLVFCMALCAGYAAHCLRARQPINSVLILMATAALSAAAALGRCDLGHALFADFGLVLAGTLLAARRAEMWRRFRLVLVVFVVALPAVVGVWASRLMISKAAIRKVLENEPVGSDSRLDRFIQRGMVNTLGAVKAREKLDRMKAGSRPNPSIDFGALYPGAQSTLYAPMAYSPTRFAIYHGSKVDQGRYLGLQDVVSPPQVDAKVAEMTAHPERQLILPLHYEANCEFDVEAERKILRDQFLIPYRAPTVHPASILQPLCAYIQTHYRLQVEPTPERFDYGLWSPMQ